MKPGFTTPHALAALALLFALDPLQTHSQARIQLSAVPSAIRVGQTGDVLGASIAEIACAKNESESIQIVVTACGGNLQGIDAEITPLQDANGHEISVDSLTLYREVFVPIRHTAPRATLPPGLVADPLVPFKNPYSGEPLRKPRWVSQKMQGARSGAARFDLWQDRHQPLWLDVHVDRNTPAGLYTGSIRVRAERDIVATIPIRLTVWDFVLPNGPTHENHFGGFGRVAAYHNLKPTSEAFHLIEERYAAMMAEHRINPPFPSHLRPKILEDGSILVDSELDRKLAEFVQRHRLTNIDIPRAPFRDIFGADKEKAIRFYRSWYAYLVQKGWDRGAYLYMLDEPNDPEAYERVRRLGALVREAEPRIRRLVVEQPYTQDPEWGSLDDAIDIWCPLFGFVHQPSVQRVRRQGDEVWSYSALVQSAPPYHPDYANVKSDNPPYWQIDFPVLSYRIAPWLNRRYEITGLLYWSTVYWNSPERNPWDDPGFRIRWNGDGFLFYPGTEAGIEGPVATIRLKNLRDGMEDYEYFALLDRHGAKEIVDSITREAVPTWGSWDQDPYRLNERRQRLAKAILERAQKNGLD